MYCHYFTSLFISETIMLKHQTMYHENKLFIFLILFFLIPFSTSDFILSPTKAIKDGDLLVSEGGSFALGYFSPGKSSKRYVGIWYKKIPQQTIVWVANRDNGINNASGVLFIDKKGNLVIQGSEPETPLWSTNISKSDTHYSTSSAQLMDTGNLILFHGDGNNKVVVWQSFDYPTHTLLPHMKLGVNLRTGLNRFVTSWKSSDDPGTGIYSFKMDIKGSPPQVFLYKGSERVWRTGPWIGDMINGVPQKTKNSLFSIIYVENSTDVYVMHTQLDDSVSSTLSIDEYGMVKRQIWSLERNQWVDFWSASKDQCDKYSHCGPYGNCNSSNPEFECQCLPGYKPKSERDWYLRDGNEGCVAKRGADDNCEAGDGFVKMKSGKLPDTNVARVNRSMGLKECEEECKRNCSCKGYASADISQGGSGCITWHGDLIDTRAFSSGGLDFYLRVDAVELAEYMKSQQTKGKKTTLAYILVPVVAVFIVMIALLLCLVKRNTSGTEKRALLCSPNFNRTSLESSSSCQKLLGDSGTNADLPHIDLNTIVTATNNFFISNKLGQGGFGTVYKGLLVNGQEIAVKRLEKNSGQGDEEFINEVILIAKLQHRNLVRLLGFCVEQEEKMLIYEYLPNKGLDSVLFDKSNVSLIDWRKRYDIILGIAKGLLYLHQDSRLRIIHRDLKASNVLLDESMNPKISDFGMARIFGGDQIEANTNKVVGTYGYMSPEYAMEGLFSVKSDVFSFGVLLLEIISGRKNKSLHQDNSMNLIGHVWSLWKEDKAMDAVDPLLDHTSYETREVLKCFHIGLLCVQEQAIDRPTMSDIAFMLSQKTVLLPPKQPAFILKEKLIQKYSSSTSIDVSSTNHLTLTEVDAR